MIHVSSQSESIPRHRSGLTLAEVAISTLIVGLMMVTALKSVGGVYTTWTFAAEQYDGSVLADQLLSEILQSHYEEPTETPTFGLETDEGAGSRNHWDDVDDYVSWSSSPPKKKSGGAIPQMVGWTRMATVQLASVADPLTVPVSDEGLKLITVTVTAPDGSTTVRQAIRSRWGALEQAPLVDSDWVTKVTIELETGSGTESLSSASLPNAVMDISGGGN